MSDYIIYVLYNKTTSDYPGRYVVRRHTDKGPDEDPIIVTKDLAKAREAIPPGLTYNKRWQNDDPVIQEIYF